jgi:hypothetical protein
LELGSLDPAAQPSGESVRDTLHPALFEGIMRYRLIDLEERLACLGLL